MIHPDNDPETSSSIPTVGFNMKRVQKGHVTLKWYVVFFV